MKFTKYIATAAMTIAMLGVATPTFAAMPPSKPLESKVSVTIVDAQPGEEVFNLKAVPANFLFESVSLEDGVYQLTAQEVAEEFRVFKNFTPRHNDDLGEFYDIYGVTAKVSPLIVNGDETNSIDVTDFSINGVSIGGSTGASTVLYGDTDFSVWDSSTGEHTLAVDSAALSFTRLGLEMEDTLSGSIVYSVSNLIQID